MEKVNYKTLKDHAIKFLFEKVNKGDFKPGKKINLNQICDELGMSITPARKAFMRLTNEGFFERVPRRGFIVKAMSLD